MLQIKLRTFQASTLMMMLFQVPALWAYALNVHELRSIVPCHGYGIRRSS